MTLVRRLAYASVAVAFLHIVFGAVVRITGSGMGCGDHWPTCYGYWIPPFSRPDLVIEVTHRYLALLLLVAIAALAAAAWRRRREPGIGGRGGVLRAAGLALLLWIAPALLGALTVFLGNPPAATVAHKALAAALLAVLAAAAIRAGGFGARGLTAAAAAPTGRARRGAIAAAAVAIVVVLLGALTAKLPGAAVACAGFPLCAETSGAPGLAHVQLTHRILAYLLALHLAGQAIGFTRRREPRPLLVASRVTVALVVLQIALAGHMVLGGFPAAVRSAHQATGMALWLTVFVVAYLAGRRPDRAPARAEGVDPLAAPGPARTLGVVATEPSATAAASIELRSSGDAGAVAAADVGIVQAAEAEVVVTADVELAEGAYADVVDEDSELDREIAAELARHEGEREREIEEREEFARAIALEMAKLEMAKLESEAEPAVAEPTAAESAALVAERLVVEDAPAFAEALERAVEAAADPAPAAQGAGSEPTGSEPTGADPAATEPALVEPARRKPLRLSMAVIVARGADL